MAATFNIYNNLSSTNWLPVDFESMTNDYKFTKTPIFFNNGVNLYLHNFLQNSEDFSFNKKTGLVLTNPTNNTFFLQNKPDPATENALTQIQTPLQTGVFQNLSAGIQAYWKLDDSYFLDSTGNGYDLTNIGNVGNGSGIISNCAIFVNPDVGTLRSTISLSNNCTLSFWFNSTQPNQDSSVLFSEYSPNYYNFYIHCEGDGLFLSVYNNGAIQYAIPNPTNGTFYDGKWHHIVIVNNNGVGTFWVDGKTNSNTYILGDLSSTHFDIGVPLDDNGYNVQDNALFCSVDEVGIWNIPLVDVDIQYLYNKRKAITYPFTNYTIQSVSKSNSLNSKKVLSVSNTNNYNSNDILTFNFQGNNTTTVKNSYGKFLTCYGTGENNLYFNDEIYPPSSSQQFNYLLNDNSIILFQTQTNYSNIVCINPPTGNLILSSIHLNINDSIPSNSILYFTSFGRYNTEFNNSIQDSFIVNYKASPLYSQSNLLVDNSLNNTNMLAQNYLAAFPVENPTINNLDSSYLLQFHGLKNYQTPEYTYSSANPYLNTTTSVNRIYNKIYSGTNQNKGYDNLYLGFQSNTKQINFPVGEETYFYFPATNTRSLLFYAGLIEDGATAGQVPFTSDRISIYRQNYQEITPGVPQPPSITKEDNTWLCSWLYGSNLGSKIWLDRYYNAAYYTLDQALSAQVFVYNDKIDPNKPYTYDVHSTMRLEPGVLYKYFRADKENSKNFITHLDSDPSNPLGGKVLGISDWSSTNLIDDSNYKNNGIVFYNTNPQNLQKTYINLDGTNSAVFPSRTSLLQNEKLTVSLWVNVKDWKNIYGEQIFGNYYSSGFGLINDSFISSPLFTIVNTSTLSAYNINYNLLNLTQKSLPALSSSSQYNIIQRLPDLSYCVFDSISLTGQKYDANNKLIGTFPCLSSYIGFIDQVELDSNQNFYFYDNNKKYYVQTDSNGNLTSTATLTAFKGINRIEIDLNNKLQPIYGNTSVIDNTNNIWEVVGGNLYKNRIIFANVGVTQQITCDSQNRIWISHLQDNISILDQTNNIFTYSQRIGKNSSSPLNHCLDQDFFRTLDFLKVPVESNCNNNSFYQDQLVIIDNRDDEVYMLDYNGNLISKLDLRGLISEGDILNFNAGGDFTGYSYLRKYGGSISKNLSWKLKIADPQGNNSQLISLAYSVSSLPAGWHNFALTFDAFNGITTYYIDSIQVNQQTFDPEKYVLYYDYRSSLVLGAASLFNTTLNDIIGVQDNYKFIGQVSDLKMYSKCLTQGEIEQIYFSSDFSYPRKDLLWNVDIGNRNYIEEVEHWFKLQLPGSKSKYFNINIHNLNIQNTDIKNIIEDTIRQNITKIAPAETSLYNINWI